jgi:hypothetical protein
MGPPMGPRMPMFPPGGPGVGQQMFYGQAPPLMPPQVTFYPCETVNTVTKSQYITSTY